MFTAQESRNPVSLQNNSKKDTWIPITYRVVDRRSENQDMVTLTLEPEGDEQIEPISPGQFNMLYAYGVGEIPISVSSLLETHPRIVHTIQDVGAVSHALTSVVIGDIVGVRGPFGAPWPMEVSKFKDVVIMAGGVGFAPLRPLVEMIAEEREEYGEVNFLYGTRDPKGILFHQDVISLQSDPSINFQITVDHSFAHWRGHVGVVTTLTQKANFNPDNTIAYVCGPEIMMRYGVYSLLDAGVPEENIYLSMERNMKCGFGHCGHCQYGPIFICQLGPVFHYQEVKNFLNISEI